MSELNHMTAPALLQVENLRVSFKNEEKQYVETVKGISFSVPVNTTLALVGESGSGKSVTSLATMGLLSPESSQIALDSKILFEGKNLLDLPHRKMRKKCGKDIAMIEGGADFQRTDLQITSDKVDYNWKSKVAVFKGNVKVIQPGLATVSSDSIKYNVETKEFVNN